MVLNRTGIFCNNGFNNNLSDKAVKNGFITISEQLIKLVFQVVSTSVMARYIMPDSYGLISMVSVVTNFVALFKDAGLSMATVQKKDITEGEISNLFWINALISVGLALIVMACSPLVSAFYGRSELTLITVFMGATLGISGLAIQHQALLRRHMRFDSLFVINIVSYVTSNILMIILAVLHFEYWTLIIGQLVNAVLSVVLSVFFCRWIPKKFSKDVSVSNMLKYGIDLTTFEIVNYFSRNLDNILIGRFCGSAQLGLYSKAYQIVYLPINNIRNPINNVAIPVMTKIADDKEKFKAYFGFQVTILSILVMPLMMGFFVNSYNFILLFFGKNWVEMNFVFKMLALTAIFQPIFGVRGSATVALGMSKLYLKMGIIGAGFTIISFICGVWFGINGVAVAYFTSFVVNQFIAFPMLFRNTFLEAKDLLKGIYPTVISAAVGGVCSYFVMTLIGNIMLILQLIFAFVVLYIVFFAVMILIPEGRRQLCMLYKLLIGKLKSKKVKN